MTRCAKREHAEFSNFGPGWPLLLLPDNLFVSRTCAARVCFVSGTSTICKLSLLLE
jgi:hypothetical protein